MNKLIEMQKNVKAIVRKYENNLIKLNLEVWKSIDSYDHYVVSSFGKVKNTKTGRILKGRNVCGYLQVVLCEDGVRKNCYVHRLVANAFLDNPDDKECVDHRNNDKINNHLTNLRWATTKENAMNQIISKNNKSKVKGICFNNKKVKKWHAQVMIDGIRIHIGYYDDLEDAKIARVNRANEAFGMYTNACEKL